MLFRSTALLLAREGRLQLIDWGAGNRVFIFLGAVTFAALAALGLLTFRSADYIQTIRRLAPLLSLFGAPGLATGLLIWRKSQVSQTPSSDALVAGQSEGPVGIASTSAPHPEIPQAQVRPTTSQSFSLGSLRTTGTAIAIIGALILVGGIILGWPSPAAMLPSALINFLALTVIAILFDIPAAHLLALPCLTLAFILTFHLIQPASHPDSITWRLDANALAQAIVSPSTGSSLVGLTALLASIAAILVRTIRRRDGLYYALFAAISAIASIGLASYFGLGRALDHGATWVFAAYAAMAFIAAVALRRREATWTGTVLLAIAIVQGVVFRFSPEPGDLQQWAFAFLLHATLTCAAGLLLRLLLPTTRIIFAQPLSRAGLATSILSAAVLILVLITISPTRRIETGKAA